MAIPSVNIIPRLGTATHSTVGPDKKEVELFLRSYSLTWPKLNDYQKSQLIGVESEPICESTDRACIWKGYRCYIQSWLALATDQDQEGGATHDSPHYNPTLPSENFCPYKFDGHVCWPFQSPGQRTFIPCSQAIPLEDFQNCQSLLQTSYTGEIHAFRDCGSNGLWVDDLTNYTACDDFVSHCINKSGVYYPRFPTNISATSDLLDEDTKRTVTYVFAGLAITSLLMLSVSFFIFCYFNFDQRLVNKCLVHHPAPQETIITLYCSRNSIHMNLFAALMLQVIALLVILSPRISGDETIHKKAWLCKSFMFLSLYTVPASIMWTFVEGLYLSQRLTLAVFKKEAPFPLYMLIGWGIPLVLVGVWVLVTEFLPDQPGNTVAEAGILDADFADLSRSSNTCWQSYSKQPYHWIITGPCLAALTVNFIFLVLVIMVLVTKLRANNAEETVQLRKAIKATFILVPLLGISNLLFFANPSDNGAGEKAYIVVNLILKGSQGIFVALIYCFLNSEVQMAIRKKFYRAALRRNPESQSFRCASIYSSEPAERRKSSTRTASTTLMTSTEVLRLMFGLRRASSREAQAVSLKRLNTRKKNSRRNVSFCVVPNDESVFVSMSGLQSNVTVASLDLDLDLHLDREQAQTAADFPLGLTKHGPV